MINDDKFIKDIESVFSRDKVIFELYKEFGMPEKNESEDVYNELISSIISQQLSVKAAKTIYGRFIKIFKNGNPTPNAILEKEFEQLRAVGLSGQKSNYVKNVAQFFLEHQLLDTNWNNKSDEEIISLLTQIKGVGIWTVQMSLMFTLNRPDVFPVGDLGIQLGMKSMYKLEMEGKVLKNKLVEIADNWKPYRSIASKLVWKAKDAV